MDDDKPVQKPYSPFSKQEQPAPPVSTIPPQVNPVKAVSQQPTQPVQSQTPEPEKKSRFGKFVLPRINKEVIRAKQNAIIGAVFAIVIIIILVALFPRIAALIRDKNPLKTPAPSATAEPTPSPSPGPSQYADDEDVKAMESDINNLSNDMRDTVLREDKLRIPDLDYNVSFDK